jgi:Metallo-beta-lactamase superfamily
VGINPESGDSLFTRRAFLAGALAAADSSGLRIDANQPRRTRLILLGTGGGPRPRAASSAAAQVIVIDNVAYVVDCGDGVARQLVLAGVPLPTIRHVFITHHHSDHNADYGNLIWLAWTAGLRTTVDTWGAAASRADDEAVLRYERVRHRRPHIDRTRVECRSRRSFGSMRFATVQIARSTRSKNARSKTVASRIAVQGAPAAGNDRYVEHGRGSIRGGSVFSVLWRATVQHPGHQRADVDLLAAGVARAERGCVAN